MRVRPRTTFALALSLVALTPLAASGLAASPTSPRGDVSLVVRVDARTSVPDAAAAARAMGGEVGHTYTTAVRGFSVRLGASQERLVWAIPGVVAVERDQSVRLAATRTSPGSYGLDRIDQRRLPLDNRFTQRATGAGVSAYVVDTGVNYSHVEFARRVGAGADLVDGGRADDCNGHGTHVAGTLAGTRLGVAPGARIHPVRVLDCQGSGQVSDVIAGVDWVTRHHGAGVPAVANLSLGGGVSAALDEAVRGSVRDGITYVVAAGNDGGLVGGILGTQDACASSPGRVSEVLTVGATDARDERTGYSNTGECLDLFAPGDEITSAWIGGPQARATISGTSMSAPHVAGVAALTLQVSPRATPAEVSRAIRVSATTGVVRDPGPGSPNRLLHTSR